MGFAGYFLIVADFIRWARENGVPVGPGRGSGAGSLVAYSIGITDLDPLRYDLLFERFLNPERVSMPDFDVDFCMDGRDRVIEYVARTLRPRARLADHHVRHDGREGRWCATSARVFGQSYGFADSIAKLIPFELGITLKDAIGKGTRSCGERYKNEEDTRAILDMAMSLEGLVRNAGMHAGGVVIAPSVLTDFAPLFCDDTGAGVVTQFDKDDVEAAGLVKFDFLGLRTLTIIDWAVKIINASASARRGAARHRRAADGRRGDLRAAEALRDHRGLPARIARHEGPDPPTAARLLRGHRRARGAVPPGPLQSGMVDDFIARKHGKTTGPIDYLHPDLKPVLAPTYGVILYQEQVMQIAQVLAGYTLGGADLLRRAMGKKKPEEMAKQRARSS